MKTKAFTRVIILAAACCLALPLLFAGHTSSIPGEKTPEYSSVSDTVKIVRSLAELRALPKGTVVETCDLSNQGLEFMPDLSDCNIRRLNISHNDLSRKSLSSADYSCSFDFLPKTLEELNMSHCNIGITAAMPARAGLEARSRKIEGESMWFEKDSFPKLRVLNLASNKFREIRVPETVEHLNVSDNILEALFVSYMYDSTLVLKHLNVSNNPDMYYGIGIENIGIIDTLIRHNCAQNQQLGGGIWCVTHPPLEFIKEKIKSDAELKRKLRKMERNAQMERKK